MMSNTTHRKDIIGDGVHDDTPGIQTLLDAGSSAVYLPPPSKHYLISRTLRIHSGQALQPEATVDGMILRDFRVVNRTPGPIVLLNNRGTVHNLVLDRFSQVAEDTPARGSLVRNSGSLHALRMAGECGKNLAGLMEGLPEK